jgi:two-component system, OmpR family, KDP operon response regulator KdpE
MLSQQARVLVADDEPSLRQALRASLRATGFSVEEAPSGNEAIFAVRQCRFDLVLLDINMPGLSGFEACRRIRDLAPRTGIVMVTVRDAEDDKVRALESGADDYITKPFRLRELVARLRSVLRRVRFEDSAQPVLQAGDLEIDFDRRLLRRAGKQVHLSPKEFDLLAYLMKNLDAPVSHAKLLRAVWGPEYGNELEYLRSYVKTLRKKIEDDPAKPEYILTEPWVGYRFCSPSDPDSAQRFSDPERQ